MSLAVGLSSQTLWRRILRFCYSLPGEAAGAGLKRRGILANGTASCLGLLRGVLPSATELPHHDQFVAGVCL